MPRHKHADLIKQWVEDTSLEVECRIHEDAEWKVCTTPNWYADSEYRIKPKEPKRLVNENFIALFMEYACANLSNQKEYQDGWYTSEMEIALDVAGSFYTWLEKQHE